MSESMFRDTWLKLLPYIVTAKPMSDLCWTCQANNSLIYRSANTPEAEESDRLLQQELHLWTVQEEVTAMVDETKERSLYTVDEAKATCQTQQLSGFVHSASVVELHTNTMAVTLGDSRTRLKEHSLVFTGAFEGRPYDRSDFRAAFNTELVGEHILAFRPLMRGMSQ